MIPKITQGTSPLILAQPHGGVEVPPEIFRRFNLRGQALADTDWHISRLYHGLAPDATIVSTPLHRYVIDTNRDPTDVTLYPGLNTTSLCPTLDFEGNPIYRVGEEPSADEIADRRVRYHRPYHDALSEQLERIRQRHGYVILYDCHSIRSRIPYLFEGCLPDFNIGSNDGSTCDPQIEATAMEACNTATGYTTVLNGRFKGGWSTRHYGAPSRGYHALQMELAQYRYMHEQAPWTYLADQADRLRVVLAGVLCRLVTVLD